MCRKSPDTSTTEPPDEEPTSADANPRVGADEAEALSKEERLAQYLRERARDGELYVKSKFIADEVELSPKEIGALMVELQESATDLSIEKWGKTRATTWRIEHQPN